MAAQSYLIFSPASPSEIAAAAVVQRQTIPLAWALAFSGEGSTVETDDNGVSYITTTVDDGLKMLDKCTTAWNWNSYFRDILSPITVFRKWLSRHEPSTKMYINISELIRKSPNKSSDIDALRTLNRNLNLALEEAEKRNFSGFIQELRKFSYPFITVPITGNRAVDMKILTFEMRDTESPEEEIALQMVGIDRDQSLLNSATEAVSLHRKTSDTRVAEDEMVTPEILRIFTANMDTALKLFSDELGCDILHKAHDHAVLNAHGTEFEIVKISKREEEEIYESEEEDEANG